MMDWMDLDAEARSLKDAQEAIERQIAAMDDEPNNPSYFANIGET